MNLEPIVGILPEAVEGMSVGVEDGNASRKAFWTADVTAEGADSEISEGTSLGTFNGISEGKVEGTLSRMFLVVVDGTLLGTDDGV